MFYEEGWVPLSEVSSEVLRRLQALQAEGKVGKGQGSLGQILSVTVWDICDAATKLGVTAADGSVVPASKDLVAWGDPLSPVNEHLDLRIGSVGSGAAAEPEAQRRRYGPFLHLPLVIPVNNFQSSMTFLAEEVLADVEGDSALADGARLILSLHRGGGTTRELARSRIGTALSRRRFKMAWAMAAAHAPELKDADRWKGI
jgi:hypothetical protein